MIKVANKVIIIKSLLYLLQLKSKILTVIDTGIF